MPVGDHLVFHSIDHRIQWNIFGEYMEVVWSTKKKGKERKKGIWVGCFASTPPLGISTSSSDRDVCMCMYTCHKDEEKRYLSYSLLTNSSYSKFRIHRKTRFTSTVSVHTVDTLQRKSEEMREFSRTSFVLCI